MKSYRQNKVTIMTVQDLMKYSDYSEEKRQLEYSPPREEIRIGQLNVEILWKKGTKKQLESNS